MDTVSFAAMIDGTVEDYRLLEHYEQEFLRDQPQRIIDLLQQQKDSFSGYRIDRLQHTLQSATRAMRDGASDEWIVAALLHDIGDGVAAFSHGEFAAAILRPYVSNDVVWAVSHHPVFQEHYYVHHFGRDPNRRDRWRDSPFFQATVNFCERWDQPSFDPDYETLPLTVFEPVVWRVFGRKPRPHGDGY